MSAFIEDAIGYCCHFCEADLRREEGVFCNVKREIWQMCNICSLSCRVKKELPRGAVLYRLEDGTRKQVRRVWGRKKPHKRTPIPRPAVDPNESEEEDNND